MHDRGRVALQDATLARGRRADYRDLWVIESFCVLIDAWLMGPLWNWAEAMLDEDRLRCEGDFDPDPIGRK